jgi:hypothetical protein
MFDAGPSWGRRAVPLPISPEVEHQRREDDVPMSIDPSFYVLWRTVVLSASSAACDSLRLA